MYIQQKLIDKKEKNNYHNTTNLKKSIKKKYDDAILDDFQSKEKVNLRNVTYFINL